MTQPKPIAVLFAVAVALAAPASAEAKRPRPLHLALGDSLAVGVQPDAQGVAHNTRHGYPNQLARRLRGVRLVNFGCGGATSGSMIAGGRPCLPERDPGYRNVSRRTSQLAAAERLLRRNRGRVALVTIDIGGNDVVGCAFGEQVDFDCLSDGVTTVQRNAPRIARRLRRAAGRGVPMAVMTVYDPFLALWREGPAGQVLARLSQDLAREQVNAALISGFERHGFFVAEVAQAFRTYEPVTTDGNPDAPTPIAVREICRLTWMCAPAPRGPDIHANRRGYALIARTFKRSIGRAVRRAIRRMSTAPRGRRGGRPARPSTAR